MLVDYHVHALGHLDYRHTVEEISRFAAAGQARGLAEIGFADHDYYRDHFNFAALAAVQERFPDLRIRLGMEVDYYPDKEDEICRFLQVYRLDYIIGSVHCLDGWIFDHPDYTDRYADWDIADLYREYYRTLTLAVGSGLFDIVGHLDLIKVFNYRPAGRAADYAEPVLTAIARSGLCVELNTNGCYKPAGEIYPSEEILGRCFGANIPLTLSSDTHAPENVGRDIARAAEMARGVGYRQIATFAKRQRVMVYL